MKGGAAHKAGIKKGPASLDAGPLPHFCRADERQMNGK
jgi:hypothetical protein